MSKTFQYLRPKSAREACELKSKYGQKAVFWAGGTDILLAWRRDAVDIDYCIDLSYLDDLRYIHQDTQGISIGALTPIAFLESYKEFDGAYSILSKVAKQFATPQIRNIATVGGNLCHAVPSTDYGVPLIALNAEVRLLSTEGERTLALEEFFKGVRKTALKNDELLIEIQIPALPSFSASYFLKKARTVVDIAQINVAVLLTADEDRKISQARISLGAVAPVPFRAVDAENLLVGKKILTISAELLEKAGEQASAATRPITDIRATAAYRKEVSKVLVKRALKEALDMLKEATT